MEDSPLKSELPHRLIRIFNSWFWDSAAVDTLGGTICLEQWVTKSGPYLLQIIACVYNSW